NELDAVAELGGQLRPPVPVVLGERILQRDDRIALDQLREERRHLVAALFPPLEAVDAVPEDFARGRVERDRHAVPMSGAVSGLEDRLDRRLTRLEVRREPALVADASLEPAAVQHL